MSLSIESTIYHDEEYCKIYSGNKCIGMFFIPCEQYDDYIYCGDPEKKQERIIDLFLKGKRVYKSANSI